MNTAPLTVLTAAEGALFEAIAARLWPGTPEDPGAREAGVLAYLDRALGGAYADRREFYRSGLAATDRAARARYGRPFTALRDEDQDALLAEMERGALEGFEVPTAADFFSLCLTHTMEGLFSDPIHGGNRDFAGWRAVGYPGPSYGYTAEEQMQHEPLRRPFRSIADLPDPPG